MVVRLVPTAFAGVKEYTKVSNGTMTIPPPIPVIAAIIPIRKPKKGRMNSHILLFLVILYDLFLDEVKN